VIDIKAGLVDCVVVYKVDRLSRSLLDFARLMEVFESHRVSLVSVTQPLNTTVSLGRLTLNVCSRSRSLNAISSQSEHGTRWERQRGRGNGWAALQC
jgi:DNA invertase Pin-like site-specific DNA recombinase